MNVHIAIPIEDGTCLACLLDYGGVIWLLDDALITVSNNAPCAAARTSESGVNAKRSILTLVIADSSLVLRRFHRVVASAAVPVQWLIAVAHQRMLKHRLKSCILR